MKELILAASAIALIVIIAFVADNFNTNTDVDISKITYNAESGITTFNQPL